ncbi:ElyC/SanA/YdcF family protein [Leptolyngbya sp. FACHB-261]|uniref:ElyC/SanA/YdcF family protein n=1 Tax=Leptolyngbya sp. FACHB-261 TaxID=2692806 RepID=UPI0016886489|nr:ElyC/SanA/YdcF family protein [Leptolyngbya sp. FACHB-261]MBD2102957.1 YdcF family protein [Leptolyngbya sp. FACHB-261]
MGKRWQLRRLLLAIATALLASWLIRFWPYQPLPGKTVILGLGSYSYIEELSAQIAQTNSDLNIIISSGLPADESRPIFKRFGISKSRVTLDNQAQDTLTNFTTILPFLERHKVANAILVCEDWRVDRSKALAEIVLGARGITYSFAPYATSNKKYSYNREIDRKKILRDQVRGYLWLFTGWDPAGQLSGEGYR